MKKSIFSMLAVAGLLFTACSDDAVTKGGSQEDARSEGYMALNVNLPTAPQVRAANDNFDDGDEDEYKVTDCALLLFQGTANGAEEDAVLLNAQPILLPDGEEGDIPNITSTYTALAKVEGFNNDGSNRLYALACLNYRNVMSINLTTGMPIIAGKEMTEESTFGDIRAMTTNVDLTSRGGAYFFMTNAVLSKAMGGTANAAPDKSQVFQLAEMDCSKIKETETEALDNPAGEIFVERAVAKATLKCGDNAWKVNETMAIAKVEWKIDNIEPATYIARNPGTKDYIGYTSGYYTWEGATPARKADYRFVGNATLLGQNTIGKVDIYRTYWCVDPQYDKVATGMLPLLGDDGKAIAANPYIAVGETPLYCYENTFNVPNQNYKNTTRALIKVTLKKANGEEGTPTFYTVNGSDEYYLVRDDAVSKVFEYIVVNSDVVKAFKNALIAKNEVYNITKDDFTIKCDRDPVTGLLKITALELSAATKAKIGDGTFKASLETDINNAADNIINAANERVVIREYQNGIMYYEARFKHFAGSGDNAYRDLAPWNTKEAWEGIVSGGTTKVAYPEGPNSSSEQNYLGRYGMVRNNWYDVEVTEFKKFGHPADPSGQVKNPDFDDPDTPDDNIVEYISAKIHVLSWAMRLQSWGF